MTTRLLYPMYKPILSKTLIVMYYCIFDPHSYVWVRNLGGCWTFITLCYNLVGHLGFRDGTSLYEESSLSLFSFPSLFLPMIGSAKSSSVHCEVNSKIMHHAIYFNLGNQSFLSHFINRNRNIFLQCFDLFLILEL